jgi:hypothetical protein
MNHAMKNNEMKKIIKVSILAKVNNRTVFNATFPSLNVLKSE